MKASLEGFRTESTGAIEHGEQREAGAVAKAEPTESKLKAARFRAKTAPHPSVNAAMLIEEFGERFGDLNVGELAVHPKDGMNDVSKERLAWLRGDAVFPSARPASDLRELGSSGDVE